MEKKCLLVAVNAKYIHTNLAVRYLKAFCLPHYKNIEMKEFSINDHINSLIREIYSEDTDIYAFSCYIWNIDMILKLCSSLKRLNPKAIIVLGGPEVSFDVEQLMSEHSFIDYVIRGEGEETLLALLQTLSSSEDVQSVAGISYRKNGSVVFNEDRPLLQNLNVIPFPYGDLKSLNNKIIYYETSRGCPFNCQYCLSSTIHGVRYFSMERVKQEIKFFVEQGVSQVKLVDRTFNCNKNHSLEIIRYIMELNGSTNFHFEVAADLMDDEMMEVLSYAPKDMFQFEIGVQSTNPEALREVSRATNLDKVKKNIKALQQNNNSHMHLDLIAGLPYEDFHSFGKSFDDIHALLPDMLQLGFLKLLKGSGIRARAVEYSMEYNSFNPYEVLKTKWISFEELNLLKDIEHLLELYYNSGRFQNSLRYLFANSYSSYFSFYLDFAEYWRSSALFASSQSTRELYNLLYRFAGSNGLIDLPLQELIKLDWFLYYYNGSIPESFVRYDHSSQKNAIHSYIKANADVFKDVLNITADDPKSLLKTIYYEVFFTNVLKEAGTKQEHIVFFAKQPQGGVKAVGYPLAEVLD